MRRALPLLLLLVGACEGSDGNVGPSISLIDESGDNAARDVASGQLSVLVRQDGRLVCDGLEARCVTPITSGDFSLVLPITSLQADTELQLRITGGDDALFGAVPAFRPFGEGIDVLPVRPVMQPALTCRELDPPAITTSGSLRLTRGRRDMAAVPRANLVLLAGGLEDDGPSREVDRYDQVVTEALTSLGPLSADIGAARGATLRDEGTSLVSLVVGDGSSWRFVSQMGPPRAERVTGLHAGAGFASAVVRHEGGAAVVGGDDSDEVTWMSLDGDVSATTRLSEPRAFPAAAFVGGELIVVSGGTVERAPRERAGESVAVEGLPAGAGGALALSPSGDALLYLGFEVDGAPSAETFVLRGCPEACAAEPGPAWEEPRAGVAFTRTDAGTLWLVGGEGSARIDLVVWDGSAPRFEAGPTLAGPRAGAAVFEQASGVVTVAGGEGPDGPSRTFEQCTPAALDPFG